MRRSEIGDEERVLGLKTKKARNTSLREYWSLEKMNRSLEKTTKNRAIRKLLLNS